MDNKIIDFLQDEKSSVALVDRMVANSSLKTVNAARCSYDNEKSEFDEKDKRLTKFLWTHEHTSPFLLYISSEAAYFCGTAVDEISGWFWV